MLLKFKCKVDSALFINLRNVIADCLKEMNKEDYVPYSYDWGFEIKQELTKYEINQLLFKTKGWLIVS